ncbi:hypothetical protein [Natrinema pallidum]|nr:hypothetical protein [Natrinema pallidum]
MTDEATAAEIEWRIKLPKFISIYCYHEIDGMRLDEYLQKNESIVAGVEAYDTRHGMSESRKGKLAVTSNRVVFVRQKGVSDISLHGVNSIEYEAPRYPRDYLYWGCGLICGSILLFTVLSIFQIPLLGLAVIGFLSGVAVLIVGFLLRRAVLTLHTPNSSFEFTSKDERLTNIAHALRGRETQ